MVVFVLVLKKKKMRCNLLYVMSSLERKWHSHLHG